MSVNKKKFIEDFFKIVDTQNGDKVVPFIFRPVQNKYYELLKSDYPDMDGVREIILKARQEGFSSLVLALFTVDFITYPNSTSICISHKRDATQRLFRKVRFYVESYCEKNGWDIKNYLKTDSKNELINNINGATFYILTAGAKVGGRGSSARNCLFSEVSYFENSERITAKEIVEGTSQQVPQDQGMIFLESTGNAYGDYYQNEWERAVRKESNYKPRFFSWEEYYSDEWIERKRKDFQNEGDFLKEYPGTPEEAFLHSGRGFFDSMALDDIGKTTITAPIRAGRIAQDGEWF